MNRLKEKGTLPPCCRSRVARSHDAPSVMVKRIGNFLAHEVPPVAPFRKGASAEAPEPAWHKNSEKRFGMSFELALQGPNVSPKLTPDRVVGGWIFMRGVR